MTFGARKIVSSTGTVITTGSNPTVIVGLSIPDEHFALVGIDVLAQNLTSSFAVYSYQASVMVNASGSTAILRGSGSAPITMQSASQSGGTISGCTVGIEGNTLQLIASGSPAESYYWAGMFTGVQIMTGSG